MTELQKSKAALIRACQSVAGAQRAVENVQRSTLKGPNGSGDWKKKAHARAQAALTKAVRKACSRANDFQAESGRNF
jgi:hypothetical protein